jgi:dolichol-phosphate mannosyltransferase
MVRRESSLERALVVVPTWNEVDSIAAVAERLLELAADGIELLVVDDGSPDGTAGVVRGLGARHPSVHLMERPSKLGLGTAYVAGFRWALERSYWAVVEMDADGSHDPGDVPRLLEALAAADLVIGSRYVAGGRIANWGLVRRGLSRAGNLYARACLGFGIRDSTSGLRAYRVSLLADIDLETVRSEGYAFQIEMAQRALRAGGRVVEVPITFTDRAAGRSKMSRRIVLEALARVTWWGLRERLAGRRREPVALPPRP